MLKKLNIVVSKYNSCNKLIEHLSSIYDIKVLTTPEEINSCEKIDIVLFSDNRNISLDLLNPLKKNYSIKYCNSSSYEKDKYEINLFKQLKYNKDILCIGINTGALLLHYLSGGRIINLVTGHNDTSHEITIENNTKNKYSFKISTVSRLEFDIYNRLHNRVQRGDLLGTEDNEFYNRIKDKLSAKPTLKEVLIGESNHEQMIYLNHLNPEVFKLIGHSTFFMSDKYFISEYDNDYSIIDKNFLESEIVYYKNTNSLVFQSNPFSKNSSNSYLNECVNLIKSYIK